MRFTLFTILTVLIFAACKDKQTLIEPHTDFGYEFFPLSIGKQLTYRVDSIIYDPVTETAIEVDTSTTYIKEVLVDTFRDELNRLSYRLEVYKRPTVNVEWVLTDVWSALQTPGQAERFEENLRFIKMVFPIRDRDVWNGNAHIDETATFPVAGETIEIFKNWAYEVLSTDEAEQIGDFSFDSVLTIQQADDENLLELRYSLEKYAEGVGLVYRKMEILDTQEVDETIPWEEKADKGFQLEMMLVDYN